VTGRRDTRGAQRTPAAERYPFRTQELHLWLLQLRPDPVHGHLAAEEVASYRWNTQYRLRRSEVKSARERSANDAKTQHSRTSELSSTDRGGNGVPVGNLLAKDPNQA
jgi:hypothetical protein